MFKWLYGLFQYLFNSHYCVADQFILHVYGKHKYTGPIGKGHRVFRYNVFKEEICSKCNKQIGYHKLASNITANNVNVKFGIRV